MTDHTPGQHEDPEFRYIGDGLMDALERPTEPEYDPGRTKPLNVALLTTDGALAFVRCSVFEVHQILQERDELPPGDRETELLAAIPDLTVSYVVPYTEDLRPLNLVANTLMGYVTDEGYARFRGTVAFLHRGDSGYADITAEQRELLTDHYRRAHQSVRAWQRSRKGAR